MASLIEVHKIYAEDLFKWFYEHVMDSCGDGAGAIVCENHRDVAEWFLDWHKEQHPLIFKFFHPKDEYNDIINYHDSNENFMFCKQIPDLGQGDYTFVVKEDCKFAHNSNIIHKYIPNCV